MNWKKSWNARDWWWVVGGGLWVIKEKSRELRSRDNQYYLQPITHHLQPSPTTHNPHHPTASSTIAAAGKYALRTYCSTIRCVLKNEPFNAIADRITSAYANGSP